MCRRSEPESVCGANREYVVNVSLVFDKRSAWLPPANLCVEKNVNAFLQSVRDGSVSAETPSTMTTIQRNLVDIAIIDAFRNLPDVGHCLPFCRKVATGCTSGAENFRAKYRGSNDQLPRKFTAAVFQNAHRLAT